MRVARLQGWTEQETRSQSFEWILHIAADYLLEAEAHSPPPEETAARSSPASPGRKRVKRTTTFQAA